MLKVYKKLQSLMAGVKTIREMHAALTMSAAPLQVPVLIVRCCHSVFRNCYKCLQARHPANIALLSCCQAENSYTL